MAVRHARTEDKQVRFSDLKFDLQNPRIPDETFKDEDSLLRYMVDEYDIEELVQSILASGWIDYEPLIVQVRSNTVYEGNRRLAALRLITSKSLRHKISYQLPQVPNPQTPPETVRVRYVDGRSEARRYMAFKHINGPFKWDAYAKAKYAAEWLSEGEDVDVVSRMLGDNHNTIRRLVNGYHVLRQAQTAGFEIADRSKKRFSFSHLYTAVSRPAVREFLGLQDDGSGGVTEIDPVPREKKANLTRLMSWLYGQESKREPTVIVSQNPNLNQLVRVIENDSALSSLIRTRRLDQAFEQVDPPAERFKDALISASKQCEDALGLSTYYDGDPTLLSIGRNLAVTVRNLRDVMVKKSNDAETEL
jgi:hypothetical protein